MGVAPDGVLLTTLLYPFARSMVPYSGDKELCLSWSDTRRTRITESLR
jgi:hypothetical protein